MVVLLQAELGWTDRQTDSIATVHARPLPASLILPLFFLITHGFSPFFVFTVSFLSALVRSSSSPPVLTKVYTRRTAQLCPSLTRPSDSNNQDSNRHLKPVVSLKKIRQKVRVTELKVYRVFFYWWNMN